MYANLHTFILYKTRKKLITTLKKSTYSRKRFHYFPYTTHRIPMKKTMDYHAQLIVFPCPLLNAKKGKPHQLSPNHEEHSTPFIITDF